MFITPSFKKSLIVEQFPGNYLKKHNEIKQRVLISWNKSNFKLGQKWRKRRTLSCFWVPPLRSKCWQMSSNSMILNLEWSFPLLCKLHKSSPLYCNGWQRFMSWYTNCLISANPSSLSHFSSSPSVWSSSVCSTAVADGFFLCFAASLEKKPLICFAVRHSDCWNMAFPDLSFAYRISRETYPRGNVWLHCCERNF